MSGSLQPSAIKKKMVVSVPASPTLCIALNTMFAASRELIEKVAHRYVFHWRLEEKVR